MLKCNNLDGGLNTQMSKRTQKDTNHTALRRRDILLSVSKTIIPEGGDKTQKGTDHTRYPVVSRTRMYTFMQSHANKSYSQTVERNRLRQQTVPRRGRREVSEE